MTGNSFKRRLREPGAQIGLWLSLADPYTAEICAGAGFDWLLIDGEHGPNDLRRVLAQLQAIAPYRSQPVVRLPVGDPTLIKLALDIGVRSLLIPMVESAEQAAVLVAATRYPPRGIRGVGAAVARASGFNRQRDYMSAADDGICLLVQIESRRGLDALEAIAAVDGVDGLFIGPADLSASLGHPGDPDAPAVRAAIEDAFRRIAACGKPSGIIFGDEAQVRHAIACGAGFVAVGTDVGLLQNGSDRLAAEFGLADAPAARGYGG